MNKAVFVKAHFKPEGKEETVTVETGEKKKGAFGFGERPVKKQEKQWVQTGYSDSRIDGKRLAENLQTTLDRLNADGYEVVSAVQVVSGHRGSQNGWSYTEGLISTGSVPSSLLRNYTV